MVSNYTILRMALASVWLLTALVSWRHPQAQSLSLIEQIGLTGNIARYALHAGIIVDAVMGVLTLLHLHAMQKWLWPAQGMVIITYSIIIAIYLPEYAWHPFGILIKNIPLLAMLWILWHKDCKRKHDDFV